VDSADLHDVQAAHLLRSLRVAAAPRVAVVVIMLGAMSLATEGYEWFAQSILLACYAVGAMLPVLIVQTMTAPTGGSEKRVVEHVTVVVDGEVRDLGTMADDGNGRARADHRVMDVYAPPVQ
jgi:hypothetical protein